MSKKTAETQIHSFEVAARAARASLPKPGGSLRELLDDAPARDLAAPIAPDPQAVQRIRIDALVDNPYQPRRAMEEGPLEELCRSIAVHGLLQPITVRRTTDPNRFEVVAGHRRAEAFRRLAAQATDDVARQRYLAVPAQVRIDVSEGDMALFALVENLQRDELTPVDAADALARYQEMEKLSSAQVAEKTGLDADRVKRLLRLQRAPDVIKEGCAKGLMVPLVGPDGAALLTPSGRPKQEHRRLDLMGALELQKLYQLYFDQTPKRAKERMEGLVQKVLREGWGFRRIQTCVRDLLAQKPQPSVEVTVAALPSAFKDDARQLVVYRTRLHALSAAERENLRSVLRTLLEELGGQERSVSDTEDRHRPSNHGAGGEDA